ncbi:MAG TPA: mechanosensitive ion channel family protein [Patescibacteria group bacterium]|nr:mechanosensitive ion channel family protein [Patescibacteria group bacterium]
MNWLFALPVFFILLLLVLFFMGSKKHAGDLIRQTLPQLLLLIVLTAGIALLSSSLLKRFFYSPHLMFILWLLFWFSLLILAVRILAYFVFDFLVLKKQRIRYPKLVREVVVFVLYIVGILLILNYYLNIRPTALWASSAVLTVVIGFALQDILGNLFSGIVLNFEDSFKLEDWVRIGDREGRVEQFGWRSFKIRTIDRELIVIPNQTASKAEVLIYGSGRQPVCLKIGVGASYQDSPDRVGTAILKALESMPEIRREPPPEVQLADFADFALNYLVKFWIDDYARHNVIASEARRRIWYAFRRQGVEIPYPKRDVYMKQERSTEIPRQALVEVLQGNDVLREIETEKFRDLLAAAEYKVFGSAETIIREGDCSDYFYHIYSGAVNVLKGGQVIARLGAGDFFGEISLVTGEKFNATVTADRESVIILVSSACFKQLIDMNEKMALKLSQVITRRQEEMRLFSEKNRRTDSAVLHKNSANLFKRIVNYFATKK